MIEYGLIFLTGLFASLHCVGMCGPIVLAYSTAGRSANPGTVFAMHLAYNGGRIASYATIGALVGVIGTTLSSLDIIGGYVSIVGGVLMVGFGLGLLGVAFFPGHSVSAGLSGLARKAYGGLLTRRTMGSKALLGLLTPLLPCGLLYAMLIKAATAGSVVGGAATMAVFGVGMSPSLILVGSLSSFFSTRLRKGAEQLAAVFIVFLGLILLLRGFHVPYLAWFTGATPAGGACCH